VIGAASAAAGRRTVRPAEVGGLQVHRHVHRVAVPLVARARCQARHRGVPDVDSRPRVAGRVAAEKHGGGSLPPQQVLHAGKEPPARARAGRGPVDHEQVNMSGRAPGGGAGHAPETGASDLASVLRDEAETSLRLPQNPGQITGVRLEIELGLAYVLDTDHVRGREGPDDHVYDYVSY